MPEANYENLMSEIKALNLSDQLRLLGEMATMIRQETDNVGHRSIMELKGKGKEIWKGVDLKSSEKHFLTRIRQDLFSRLTGSVGLPEFHRNKICGNMRLCCQGRTKTHLMFEKLA